MTLSRLRNVLVVACVGCLLSGCSSLPKFGKTDLPPETSASAQQQAKYVVELHSNFGKPKLYEGVIGEATRVQDALEASGAMKQFSSMSVDLYRPVPGNLPLKLVVEFKGKKQIRYEQDYALHPGDRIIVKPKSDSPIEKMVTQVFGEL